MPKPDPFGDLIAPFSRRGVDLGLERLQNALAELGHPEQQFAAVQVAGTNGKGSISTMLERIGTAAGLRTGLYTSPHLLSWCERIRLPDGLIGVKPLREHLAGMQALALRHELTPFELITAAAFVAFAEAGVELAVLEVGLGGRLDATTTHSNRQVLALAAIGMDHTEHLGSTLAAIAGEKAGVLHKGAIAVSGPQAPEAEAVLRQVAQARQCTLRWVEPLAAASAGGPLLGLRGELQRYNAAVAVGAAQALAEQGWPGRLEHRRFQGQPLMVDGAHNPPAAEALRRELDDQAPRRWLIGSQRHKDAPALLRILLRAGDAVRVVPLPDHPSWSASALREVLQALPPEAVQIAAGSGDLAADLTWLVQSEALPVVAGSLYLVAEVLPLLDPAPD